MAYLNPFETADDYGGIIVWFALAGEAAEIRQHAADNGEFTATFSNRDVSPRGYELCFVALKENILDSIWLGVFGVNAKKQSARRQGKFFKTVSLDALDVSEWNLSTMIAASLNRNRALVFALARQIPKN